MKEENEGSLLLLKELSEEIRNSGERKITGIRLLSLEKLDQNSKNEVFIYEGEEKNIFDVVVGLDEFAEQIARRSFVENKKIEEKIPEVQRFNKFIEQLKSNFTRVCNRVKENLMFSICPKNNCHLFLECYRNGLFDSKETLQEKVKELCKHIRKELMEGSETHSVDLVIRELKLAYSKTLDLLQECSDKFSDKGQKLIRLEFEEKLNEMSSWLTQSGRGLVSSPVSPVFYCLADCGEVQARKITGKKPEDFVLEWKSKLGFLPADNDNHLNCIDVSPDGSLLAVSECRTKQVYLMDREGATIAKMIPKEKDKDDDVRVWRICWWSNSVLGMTFNDESFLKITLDKKKMEVLVRENKERCKDSPKSNPKLFPFEEFGVVKQRLFWEYGCMETQARIDENRILFGGANGCLLILNGELETVFEMNGFDKPHLKRIHDMVLCERGKSVITSSEDKTVKRICLLTKKILWSVKLPQECFEISVDHSEFFALIGYSNRKNIYGVSAINASNGTILDSIRTKASIKSVIPFKGEEHSFLSSFKINNSMAKFICKI